MTRWTMVLVLVAGCSGTPCAGVVCGPCPESVTLRVHLAGAGPVSITGADIACTASDPGTWICTGALAPGEHAITIGAPDHADHEVTIVVGAPPAGCCTCPVAFDDDVTLAPAMPPDGGVDAGAIDAGAVDGAAADADGPDASSSTCNPDAVRFPMGGSLSQGTLCDDVFACVDDADGAARVMAASTRFVCSSEPEGPCPAWTCAYRDPGGPSTLEGDEIREICAVTLLVPTPEMECRVYL